MSNNNFIKIISYSPELKQAFFVKRFKRFFVEFKENIQELENTPPCLAHTNNTGSMLGLIHENNPILISQSLNTKRKLPYTLEAICPKSNWNSASLDKDSVWCGVNTALPNKFLQALFTYQCEHNVELLPFALGYDHIRMEVKYNDSRLDAKISSGNPEFKDIWVECKNVSLVEDEIAAFPDAISERAIKHLNTLQELIQKGSRAVMLYVIQRLDAKCFSPADYIDENYAKALKIALNSGVEICIIQLQIRPDGAYFAGELPLSANFNREL